MINRLYNQKIAVNNNFQSKNTNNNFIKLSKKNKNNYQADTISFKARPPVDLQELGNSINVVHGINFAFNLVNKLNQGANFSVQLLSQLINKQFANVTVKSMQELGKIIPNASDYRAYSTSNFDSAFKRIDLNMYVMTPKSPHEIPELVSDAAHECTHISQALNQKDDIEILKKVSKSNRRVSETLRSLYDSTFAVFDVNAISYIPIVQKKEGDKVIDSHVKHFIGQLLRQINEKEDKTLIDDFLSVYSKPEAVIPHVKQYCGYRAIQEKEAYATEYVFAGLSGRPNSHYYKAVEFFSNLADAFKGK